MRLDLQEQVERLTRGAVATEDEPQTPAARAEHCIGWIERYCKVMSDTGGGAIPFLLFDYQKDFIRQFWAHRELIVLKARQIGMTETVAAIAVYCIHQFPGWTIILLSQNLETARQAMLKCRVAYDYLPDGVRVPMANTAITSYLALANHSRILVMPTTVNSARSLNCQVLIIDEWARQSPHLQEEVYAAAAPTARSAGNRIVGMSTANGVGNFFHKQWVKAVAGDSTMQPIFLPWHVRPGRDEAWFARATSGFEDWQIAQELPANAAEAFILSGRPRFDVAALRAMLEHCPDPIGVDLGGALRVWERPTQNGRYVIGADTAEGLPKGDYSVAVVCDYHTGLDVAELHGHFPDEEFAAHLAALGRWYNTAYLAVEWNMGQGVVLALDIIHAYPNLHYQQDVYGNPTEKPGWRTTSASKIVMIDALAATIRERRPYRNAAFIGEALTYARDDKGATAASGDAHDDRVIAYALAEIMRSWSPPTRVVQHEIETLQLQDYAVDSRY